MPSWVLTKPTVEQNWSLCLQTFEGHSGPVNFVTFSPDGSRIASGSYDHTIKIWDAKSGKEIRTLEGHSSRVSSVAFSPDGSRIASGSYDHTIKIWDAKSGKEIRTLEGHSSRISSVAFSPDGSRIASGSDDQTVRIWDAKVGKEIRTLGGHSSGVFSVAFSPDGNRIASGSDDQTVRIWDAKSGKEVRTLEGHSSSASPVAFSPDGSRIASGSGDGTVRIGDAKSGNKVRKLNSHRDQIDLGLGKSCDNPHQDTSEKNDKNTGSVEILGLRGKGSWVTWHGRNAVWLPPDYRPGVLDVSDDGSAIVIGCCSGRVVIMRMSLEPFFSRSRRMDQNQGQVRPRSGYSATLSSAARSLPPLSIFDKDCRSVKSSMAPTSIPTTSKAPNLDVVSEYRELVDAESTTPSLDDATIYSADHVSGNPEQTAYIHLFISELAVDMTNVQEFLNSTNEFPGVLESVLKAFTWKIHDESLTTHQREASVFLHKHRG